MTKSEEKYNKLLDNLTIKTIESNSTPRGRIYDRNYNLLVDNEAIKTIYYKKPNNITTKEEIETAYKVAEYIEVNYKKLTEKQLKKFWILNNKEEPTVDLGLHCFEPYECPYFSYCTKFLPENNIFNSRHTSVCYRN